MDRDDDDDTQVLASIVRGTIVGFSTLGLSPEALTKIAGLSPEALADPDALVDGAPLFRLWNEILTRFPERPVGLQLARGAAQLRRESVGVFGYASRHCRDVRQSIELFIRYCPMLFPGVSLHLSIIGEEARVRAELEERTAAMIEPVELLVASLVYGLDSMNEQTPRPTAIFLRHAAKHSPEIYAEYFPIPVHFEADWNGFSFDAAALDLPVTGADPKIGRYLQQLADAQLEARGLAPAEEPFDAQVRSIIDDHLMAGTTDQSSVAKVLGMSPRTLQRRLEEQGTSFGRQLEDVRRARAQQLLGLPSLSVGEVAFMLGYQTPRAFYRSFRRWTGQTPSEYRRTRAR